MYRQEYKNKIKRFWLNFMGLVNRFNRITSTLFSLMLMRFLGIFHYWLGHFRTLSVFFFPHHFQLFGSSVFFRFLPLFQLFSAFCLLQLFLTIFDFFEFFPFTRFFSTFFDLVFSIFFPRILVRFLFSQPLFFWSPFFLSNSPAIR